MRIQYFSLVGPTFKGREGKGKGEHWGRQGRGKKSGKKRREKREKGEKKEVRRAPPPIEISDYGTAHTTSICF